jgi:hypothetical protein
MRRYLLTLSVFLIPFILFVWPFTPAQARGLGAKVGFAFANQSYDYTNDAMEFDSDYRTGLAIGLFKDLALAPSLALRGEALYIQKGFKISALATDYEGNPLTKDFQYRMDYLSFSLMAKATMPSGTYLIGGPRLDLKLGTEDDGLILNDLEDKFETTVFGLSLGVGQELTFIPQFGLFIEGMYHLDLAKLYERAGTVAEDGALESVKNKTFTLSAGVKF